MIVLRSTYEREREARERAEKRADDLQVSVNRAIESERRWTALFEEAQGEVRHFVQTVIAMKREGFTASPVLPEREQEPSLPLPIRAAIDTVAEPNSREHGDAVALARRLMQGQEQTPENVNLVVERILRGGRGPEMGG